MGFRKIENKGDLGSLANTCGTAGSLGDLTGLELTGSYPNALNLTVRQDDADTLQIGAEFTLVNLNNVRTNTSRFLGDTLADNATTRTGAFTGYKANF